tara:strand:- start:1039 stop:1236 length:198 start_codon:yes stop_codon:yes gene_type:complete
VRINLSLQWQGFYRPTLAAAWRCIQWLIEDTNSAKATLRQGQAAAPISYQLLFSKRTRYLGILPP